MAPAAFRPPSFEFGDGAAAFVAEEQHSAAVRRRHLPQLRPQALVIRVILNAAFPRQLIDVSHSLIAGAEQLIALQLQIELHRLLQPSAPFPLAPPRSVAAADLEEDHESDEGEGE